MSRKYAPRARRPSRAQKRKEDIAGFPTGSRVVVTDTRMYQTGEHGRVVYNGGPDPLYPPIQVALDSGHVVRVYPAQIKHESQG